MIGRFEVCYAPHTTVPQFVVVSHGCIQSGNGWYCCSTTVQTHLYRSILEREVQYQYGITTRDSGTHRRLYSPTETSKPLSLHCVPSYFFSHHHGKSCPPGASLRDGQRVDPRVRDGCDTLLNATRDHVTEQHLVGSTKIIIFMTPSVS